MHQGDGPDGLRAARPSASASVPPPWHRPHGAKGSGAAVRPPFPRRPAWPRGRNDLRSYRPSLRRLGVRRAMGMAGPAQGGGNAVLLDGHLRQPLRVLCGRTDDRNAAAFRRRGIGGRAGDPENSLPTTAKVLGDKPVRGAHSQEGPVRDRPRLVLHQVSRPSVRSVRSGRRRGSAPPSSQATEPPPAAASVFPKPWPLRMSRQASTERRTGPGPGKDHARPTDPHRAAARVGGRSRARRR